VPATATGQASEPIALIHFKTRWCASAASGSFCIGISWLGGTRAAIDCHGDAIKLDTKFCCLAPSLQEPGVVESHDNWNSTMLEGLRCG
jgi:hypothetical protein